LVILINLKTPQTKIKKKAEKLRPDSELALLTMLLTAPNFREYFYTKILFSTPGLKFS
jgi:hypothetical protein